MKEGGLRQFVMETNARNFVCYNNEKLFDFQSKDKCWRLCVLNLEILM